MYCTAFAKALLSFGDQKGLKTPAPRLFARIVEFAAPNSRPFGRVTDGIISPLASFTKVAFGYALRWRAGDRQDYLAFGELHQSAFGYALRWRAGDRTEVLVPSDG